MTVCFVARNDFETKPGGDTVKWLSYQSAAHEAGFETMKWFDDRPAPKADLYHCINLDRPYDLYPKMVTVHKLERPFVISSIHRPNAWLEKFRRFEPPNGWVGRLFYLSPLGSTVGRSESVKDAVRLIQQGRLRYWKGIFPGWTQRCRWLIEHAESILLLSRKEGDAFEKDFGIALTPDKIRLVPNWVSFFGNSALEIPSEFKTLSERPILVIGRIEAAKNSLRVCQLASQVDRPLIFIGRANPYEEKYVNRFKKLVQRSPCVRWIPGLPRSELAGYYSHAAFLLNASYFEGCPWVDMEALLFGCSLVTTEYALHHEFLPADVPKCDPYNDENLLHFLRWRPPPRVPCQPIDQARSRRELISIYERTCKKTRATPWSVHLDGKRGFD